jgi:hypothetical protein
MNGESTKFEAYKKKMQNLCDENNLIFELVKHRYPISITIKSVRGLDGQMSMIEDMAEDGYRSPDARLMFYYEDGEIMKDNAGGKFGISVALEDKIKRLFKNLHFTWLQFFFRSMMERDIFGRDGITVPEIQGDEDGDDEDDIKIEDDDADDFPGDDDAPDDLSAEDKALLNRAIAIVRDAGKATMSMLQKHLKIGYAKASRMIDEMEAAGVIGPYKSGGTREVLPFDAFDGVTDYTYDEPDENAPNT